ncbi:hypothetical protein EZV62_004251 [Acer yangbiense]|uniref:Uncharacterized protein n=1 Tax=Acer yangbiense TaxID=1000413 RepID=A0A5C7ILG8_9ROSI|nr:hypothetical protein EZV62_004251 [Acer yangbiense]
MLNQGVQPNTVTFSVLRDEPCNNGKIDKANKLYELIIKREIVCFYGKACMLTVVSYNILMEGHNDSESGVILDEIADLMLTGNGVAVSSISRNAYWPAYVLAREALKISGDALFK